MIGIVEAMIISSVFFLCRHILGYAYSNDLEVINYVAQIVPLLCLSVSSDSLAGILCGKFLFIDGITYKSQTLGIRIVVQCENVMFYVQELLEVVDFSE